jgi:hypothetical protein
VGGSASRRQGARYALAGVRLFNGTVGLFAPNLLIRRFDGDRPAIPAAINAFRLFGVRTILLGLELLTGRDEELQRALREGVVIHASDVVTAALLGLNGQVPRRTAVTTVLISATNVTLALAAAEPSK